MNTALEVRSFDGLALHAVASGNADGPAVVLSHSIGGDLASWDPVADVLADRYRVLRFDRRGHGRSGVPAHDATIQTLGRDALAVMDAFGAMRPHFVGLSQGAMEGMWLAAEHPERIDRLVLANTTAYLGAPERIQAAIDAGFARGMTGVGSGMLDAWLTQAFRDAEPALTARLRATFGEMTPQGFAACAAVLKSVDLRPRLAAIKAPTLVIVGGAEGPPLQEAAQALVAGISGARLASINGSGHLSAVDRPAEFSALLELFLG